jgi:glycosyltransferase involved in cell wall biosynthesis
MSVSPADSVPTKAGMRAPDIAVIIPTYGRANTLAGCLRALAAQTLVRDRFEVVVCDDGSHDPVSSSLATLIEDLRCRLHLRVLRQERAGPAAARNRGAAMARARWLAFTDDDCRPAPDWLERLLARFATAPDTLIGGGLEAPPAADARARATQVIMDFVYAEQERRGGMRLFSTSNLALPAAGFHRLGGFSSAFARAGGEDYDLCARWYALAGPTTYAPEARITHEHSLTLARYLRQHFEYGRGLLRMRRRLHARGIDLNRERRLQRAVWRFYLRLIAAPVRQRGARGTGCALLVALAQMATAAGGLREALRFTRAQARGATSRAPDGANV